MTEDDVLDIQGIDALLGRFRSRKRHQKEMRHRTADWGADNSNLLRADLLEALRLRLDSTAERAAADFSAVLRIRVDLRIESIEQLRFGRFVERISEPGFFFRLDVSELSHPAYIFSSELTVASAIDLLLGGQGRPSSFGRNLSVIEQRVLNDLLGPFVQGHQACLSTITPLHMSSAGCFDSVAEIRPYAESEACVAVRYRAKLESEEDWIFQLVLPVSELVPALEAVASLPIQSEETTVDRRRALETRIGGVDIEAGVTIGSTELSLAEITALEAGDVIVLGSKPGDLFGFEVEGVEKYRGQLGRIANSMAFEVVQTTSQATQDS